MHSEEAVRALSRKNIEVKTQQHFRRNEELGLEELTDYISRCDAVVFFVGNLAGQFPTPGHAAYMNRAGMNGHLEEAPGLHPGQHSCQKIVSYTQWEFIVAKSFGRKTCVYLTDTDFIPRTPLEEPESAKQLQQAYRQWIMQVGQPRTLSNENTGLSNADFVEDILVSLLSDSGLGKPDNLPYPGMGSLFIDHDQRLEKLRQQVHKAEFSITAITPPAKRKKKQRESDGSGKTQLAIEYARRNGQEYSALLYVNAQSQFTLKRELAGLVKVLPVTDDAEGSMGVQFAAVMEWFRSNPNWLLIFDDVDCRRTVEAIQAELASFASGHILIVCRRAWDKQSINSLQLSPLDAAGATEYLLEATEMRRTAGQQDTELAGKIADNVGGLPLNLLHAAGSINARESGFSDYLKQWNRTRKKIANAAGFKSSACPKATLITLYCSARQLKKGARNLLEVLSWYSSEPIPESLLTKFHYKKLCITPQSVQSLVAFGLISRYQNGQLTGFQMHPSVQQLLRDRQRKRSEFSKLEAAIAWMDSVFNGNFRDKTVRETLEPLVGHVISACQHAVKDPDTADPPVSASLLQRAGSLYFYSSRIQAAEPLLRHALSLNENHFGIGHQKTVQNLSFLGLVLTEKGHYLEAEALFRRALSIDEEFYGDSHFRLSAHLNNLAVALQESKQLYEAESLVRRALSIQERQYEQAQRSVAKGLNKLASILYATGRLEEAEPEMRRSLELAHGLDKQNGDQRPELQYLLVNYSSLLKKIGFSEEDVRKRIADFL